MLLFSFNLSREKAAFSLSVIIYEILLCTWKTLIYSPFVNSISSNLQFLINVSQIQYDLFHLRFGHGRNVLGVNSLSESRRTAEVVDILRLVMVEVKLKAPPNLGQTCSNKEHHFSCLMR